MATLRDDKDAISKLVTHGTLYELFDSIADERPNAIALVDAEDEAIFSYAEVRSMSRRAANFLVAQGCRRGDNVVSWLPNCVESIALHIAATRLGVNTVGINTKFRTLEAAHFFKYSRPPAVFVMNGFADTDYASMAEEARVNSNMKIINIRGLPSNVPGVLSLDNFDAYPETGYPSWGQPEDLAVCFTTSGTTGLPKLAAHDQLAIVLSATLVGQNALRLKAPQNPDVVSDDPASRKPRKLTTAAMLLTIPNCGLFGHAVQWSPLIGVRSPVVFIRTYNPEHTAFFAEVWGTTNIGAPDIIVDGLADYIGKEATFKGKKVMCRLERWKEAWYPNFMGIAEQVTDKLQLTTNGRTIGYGCYGSSEVMAYSMWPAPDFSALRKRPGGRLIHSDPRVIAQRICDPDTGLEVEPGQPGELQARGPGVLNVYLNNDEATKKAFALDKEGRSWYKTGDMVVQASGPDGKFVDRAFFFLARMGDALRVRGYLTNPEEIELEIREHPHVEMAQVVGVPVEGYGDVLVAFVSLHDKSCSLNEVEASRLEEELIDLCKQKLAKYKVPTKFHFVTEWPLTIGPNGAKIQKVKLRETAKSLPMNLGNRPGAGKGAPAKL